MQSSLLQSLKHDKNALVRHEACFSLGQLDTEGVKSHLQMLLGLTQVFLSATNAVALGVIGLEEARKTLNEALPDESEEVRESAAIALANLDYIKATDRANSLFSKMTGG